MSRLLNNEDMIRIVESNEAELVEAHCKANAWGKQIAGDVYSVDTVKKMVAAGQCRANTVLDEKGAAAYVIFYGFTVENWLSIHALIALKPSVMSLAEDAICQLAKYNGCPVVQGTTLRSGMLWFLQSKGWNPCGVVVTKKL